MQSSTKKVLGPGWQDAGITGITNHAPTGSLLWLYPLTAQVSHSRLNKKNSLPPTIDGKLVLC